MSARFGTVPRTALILVGLAVLILAVLLLTDRGDLTSATLVLVAFACFITGLFLFSFRREKRIGQQPAALMAVPYTNTLSRILADLGVTGTAHFLPVPGDGTFPAPVMQYNPVSGSGLPDRLTEDLTFPTEETAGGHPGVLTVPSGIPLLSMMERERSLTLPSTEPELLEAIREVHQDLLELTPKATVTKSGPEIVIELKDFRLIEGCKAAQDESPRNCVTAPCPVCSLAGVMLAKALQKPCSIEQVLVDRKTDTIEVRIRVKEEGTASKGMVIDSISDKGKQSE